MFQKSMTEEELDLFLKKIFSLGKKIKEGYIEEDGVELYKEKSGMMCGKIGEWYFIADKKNRRVTFENEKILVNPLYRHVTDMYDWPHNKEVYDGVEACTLQTIVNLKLIGKYKVEAFNKMIGYKASKTGKHDEEKIAREKTIAAKVETFLNKMKEVNTNKQNNKR